MYCVSQLYNIIDISIMSIEVRIICMDMGWVSLDTQAGLGMGYDIN